MCLPDDKKARGGAGGGGNVVDGEKVLVRGAISRRNDRAEGGGAGDDKMSKTTRKKTSTNDELTPDPDSRLPTLRALVLLLISLPLSFWFSHEFPHMLSEKAARYYVLTNFRYDEKHTRFDNSAWTYVTDYVITVFMTYGSIVMLRLRNDCARRRRMMRGGDAEMHLGHLQAVCGGTSALLASYALSVLAGGLSHQHFTTVSSLNTTDFRIMWSIVVGAVAAASGFIGYIGSNLGLYFNSSSADRKHIRVDVPVIPTWFWVVWGVGMTCAVLAGGMSFYRPACDIFIAGTSQFFSTAYAVAMILSRRFGRDDPEEGKGAAAAPATSGAGERRNGASSGKDGITEPLLAESRSGTKTLTEKDGAGGGAKKDAVGRTPDRSTTATTVDFGAVDRLSVVLFVVGFFGNAPLLPMYPELLHTGLDLGVVNTILHCWLCVTWGMQFLSLRRIYLSQVQPSRSRSRR